MQDSDVVSFLHCFQTEDNPLLFPIIFYLKSQGQVRKTG